VRAASRNTGGRRHAGRRRNERFAFSDFSFAILLDACSKAFFEPSARLRAHLDEALRLLGSSGGG